jgi:hypothetical protein
MKLLLLTIFLFFATLCVVHSQEQQQQEQGDVSFYAPRNDIKPRKSKNKTVSKTTVAAGNGTVRCNKIKKIIYF